MCVGHLRQRTSCPSDSQKWKLDFERKGQATNSLRSRISPTATEISPAKCGRDLIVYTPAISDTPKNI